MKGKIEVWWKEKKSNRNKTSEHTKSERKEMSWPRPSRWWPTISQFKVYSFSVSLSFDSEQEKTQGEEQNDFDFKTHSHYEHQLFILYHLD